LTVALPKPNMDRPLVYMTQNDRPSKARVRLFIGSFWTTAWITDTDWDVGLGALASVDSLAVHICERWGVSPNRITMVVEDVHGDLYLIRFPEGGQDLRRFNGAVDKKTISMEEAEEIVRRGY